MALKSNLFEGNKRLNACLTTDSAHVVPGEHGTHVGDIQIALIHLDKAEISEAELASMTYGQTTAAAVLAYKRKRDIINRSYQSQADNIVGKMTIAALDKELFDQQIIPEPSHDLRCDHLGGLCRHEPLLPSQPKRVPDHIRASWSLGTTTAPKGLPTRRS